MSTKSPLRWQSPSARRHQRNLSIAASGRLQHLQAVATWAAGQVPPLGAFLGAHLASACQFLSSPPPPSSNFTCQRCESILQIGINCSVCIKSIKRKKHRSVTTVTLPAINCIVYSCHYCAFENIKSGTPKAYVKTKLCEMAAHHKFLESNKALTGKTPKTSEKDIMSATKSISTANDRSSGKKTKRKGWLSLKQLAASSADLSPLVSKVISVKSTISTITRTPKLNNSRCLKSTFKFSQLVSDNIVTPASSINEHDALRANCMKFNLKLNESSPSGGATGSKNSSDPINVQKDLAVSAQNCLSSMAHARSPSVRPHEEEEGVMDSVGKAASNSSVEVEHVSTVYNMGMPDRQCSIVVYSPQKRDLSGSITEGINNEQLSCYQSGINDNVLGQLTIAYSNKNHNNVELPAKVNCTDMVSQRSTETLSLLQGFSTNNHMTSCSSSVSMAKMASVHVIPNDSSLKLLQSPPEQEHAILTIDKDRSLNSSSTEPAKLFSLLQVGSTKLHDKQQRGRQQLTNKREHDGVGFQNIAKKQKPTRPVAWDYKMHTKKHEVICNSVSKREVTPKMKPLFWRMGGQWFTRCGSKKLRWRLFYMNTGITSGKHMASYSSSMNNECSATKVPRSLLKKEPINLTSGIEVADTSSVSRFSRLQPPDKLDQKCDKERQSLTKKRKIDVQGQFCKVTKRQKLVTMNDLDDCVDITSGKLTRNAVCERDFRSKMKPLFWRMGRHWFTKSRSKKIHWRVI